VSPNTDPPVHPDAATWGVDDGRPLHAETGYLRPAPGGRVELVLAHPNGEVDGEVLRYTLSMAAMGRAEEDHLFATLRRTAVGTSAS